MPASTPATPNLVFIFVDDLGQGDVSCFNESAAWHTENIDRLAAQGMRFVDNHATSALCTPSRYGLLTGRYNWRSRLKKSVLPGDASALIEKDRLTLPAMLKQCGYRTAAVGKWHLGMDWQLLPGGSDYVRYGTTAEELPAAAERFGRSGNFDPDFQQPGEGLDIDFGKPVTWGPNDLGFDYFFGTAASLDQPPYVYIENRLAQGAPDHVGGDQAVLDRATAAQQQGIQKGVMVSGYDVHQVAGDMQARVLDLLDDFAESDEPFFLYYPTHLVHGPIIPDEPWQGSSGAGPYGDFVLQLDAYVGQIMDKLDALGSAEDTIVIFTSDNGCSGVADVPHLRSLGHDPSNGFRGLKTDIWEGGHREPLVVRWAGQVEAGSVSTQTVCHSDIFRTMAEIVGYELPGDAGEDSVSNLPLWQGGEVAVRTDLVNHSGGGGFAIRRGDWKLEMVTTGDGFATMMGQEQTSYVPAQLYNLAADPAEETNLIDEQPELVAELSEALANTSGPDGALRAPRRRTSATCRPDDGHRSAGCLTPRTSWRTPSDRLPLTGT